jgi:hypothetical protein
LSLHFSNEDSHPHDFVVRITRTQHREKKARESRLPLVRVEEDGIIAHGVVPSKLVVELNFEIKCVRRVEVYGGNSTSIETVVDEARPPAVRDVQTEPY